MALGIAIRYTYNLLPGLAVTASGATALRLADEPWVVSIELDRTVRAL
ncbi:MAG: protease inhibitor I9 family protein [Anaerolineae bacterium]|nr:protease inhibitor I9 family protein [Anaerolineae bacterium]